MTYVASCFISYNHADAPLARSLAAALEEKGYYVWIDEGQIRVGDGLIQSIGNAIDQVDFLIALVSENSVQSVWRQKELALAMTAEINRRGISLLPCRVGDATMPPTSWTSSTLRRAQRAQPRMLGSSTAICAFT